jgi:hypothetical protein
VESEGIHLIGTDWVDVESKWVVSFTWLEIEYSFRAFIIARVDPKCLTKAHSKVKLSIATMFFVAELTAQVAEICDHKPHHWQLVNMLVGSKKPSISHYMPV